MKLTCWQPIDCYFTFKKDQIDDAGKFQVKTRKREKKFQRRFKAIDILLAGDLVSHLSGKMPQVSFFLQDCKVWLQLLVSDSSFPNLGWKVSGLILLTYLLMQHSCKTVVFSSI